jgi:membrane fusion protein YbhG
MEEIMKNITIASIMILTIVLLSCTSDNDGELEYSGTIESTDFMISSQLPGKIESLFFDEGDRIEKGDTLAVINHDKLDLQLAQAIAQKQGILAQMKMIKTGARKEDRKLVTESLIQAEASYKVAKANKDRMVKLLESKTISQKDYDDAILGYEVAESRYKSAKQNVLKSKSARPEEIEYIIANLEQVNASISLVENSINDCYITSPISGQIANRFMEESEIVSFLSSLFKIIDLSETELTVYVSEVDIAYIQLNKDVKVYIDGYTDKSFSGKITFISPEAEFTPKNIQTKDERTKLVFAVKVKISNPEKILKPGMPADAVIKI